MSSARRRELRAVVGELANALQGVAGLVTLLRHNSQAMVDDAVALEAAVGRAISALKRVQPGGGSTRGGR